ncbi:MAG: 16S rRNA (guanine(966)-N(2))-methyltransferase RsmD [Candidatus Dojkabacteria bacterium]|nr:16S rRNA (guanine(966)-N(2))-methyltransferase RsmD [Candidatus Dojkabacteria bacterium]
MNPRIISGSAKGQRLTVPVRGTRPMTDRVKSALFSMMQPLIQDSNILDLYSGTGALGIECISRGAKSAVFVDKSKEAVLCINENLKKTGFYALAKVVKASVSRFLEEYDTFDMPLFKYQVIFITPPHDKFKEKIIFTTAKFLAKDGVIVAEVPVSKKIGDELGNLKKVDERSYGITKLAFYKTKESQSK